MHATTPLSVILRCRQSHSRTSLCSLHHHSYLNNLRYGKVEVAKELLDRGACPNACTDLQNTPLMYAAAQGSSDMIMLLTKMVFNVTFQRISLTDRFRVKLSVSANFQVRCMEMLCLTANQQQHDRTVLISFIQKSPVETHECMIKEESNIL